MMIPSEPNYREFLLRYAENTKKRNPAFSYGSWAKALGLKSTSSLTKVLHGEREAGPELVEKFVRYFRFGTEEAGHFRSLVSISKLRNHEELKADLLRSLFSSRALTSIESRLLEFDRYELLASFWNLAVRELARIPKMTIRRMSELLPSVSEDILSKSLNLMMRMKLVTRTVKGHFEAIESSVHTAHESPSDAIREFHRQSLAIAAEKLEAVSPAERDFQSLTLLVDSAQLPELKKRLRDFLDQFEKKAVAPKVDRLYQIQFQFFPVSESFEKTSLVKKGDPS